MGTHGALGFDVGSGAFGGSLGFRCIRDVRSLARALQRSAPAHVGTRGATRNGRRYDARRGFG
eukprot:6812281-Pyramimonas_sp.AAC.1